MHRLQQWPEPLEPVVVPDEERDQVLRREPELLAEPAPDLRRIGHGEPPGVDRVGDHVDPLAGYAVVSLQVAPDHLRDRHDPGPAGRVVLAGLDRPVHPRLRVQLLAGHIRRATPSRPEPPRVVVEAGRVDAPLRDDDVVVPGVDESDRAVERAFRPPDRPLGIDAEVPGLPPAGQPRRLDRDEPRPGGQGTVAARLGEDGDLMPAVREPVAEVDHVGLRSALARVDPPEVQGDPHGRPLKRMMGTAGTSRTPIGRQPLS